MTTHTQPIDDTDPLVVRESSADTDGEYVRFELTLHPCGHADDSVSDLVHSRWSIDFPTEHVHPRQEERWRVLSGALGVAYGETENVLTDGDTVTLLSGVPHRIWNPLDEPSRVVLEFHPALEAQSLTETLYVLAQNGDTNEKGQLKILQFAVTQAAHPGHLYLTTLPIGLQKLLVTVLAPIGRRVGYRATYPLDSLERDY